MPDADKLTPADPSDIASALAFAFRFEGRKRVHNAHEIMAEIVAKRLVEHLDRAGFIVMKKPPEMGAAALARGYKTLRTKERGENEVSTRRVAAGWGYRLGPMDYSGWYMGEQY